MIPQSQIDEILEKNDIEAVVGEYVRLTRKGSNSWGLCPFHQEKTPSFSVNQSRQIFKCFGCGKGGNVIHFIMLAENLDYYGALEFLANRAGIRLRNEGRGPDTDKLQLKNDILSLNRKAARFFFENLFASRTAQAYFQRRGISVEIVKKFGLGYATDAWDGLLRYCTEGALALKPEFLLQAGLVLKSPEKDHYYDRFRNRVMFPILDVMGNVIAFGGRVLDDSKPKYLNSPETPAYNKGYHLYGLNYARKTGSKRVIIVEGYMDCIALHQKGIEWSVASLGTALTQNQARLLKRHFDEVLIGYDADGAGQNATIRGLDILAAHGLRVKVLSLADVDASVKDPDEFLRKHTAEEFMQVVDRARTLVQFKIERLASEFPPSDPGTRPDFLRRVAAILAQEPVASVRAMYISSCSEQYAIDRQALGEDVAAVLSGGRGTAGQAGVRGGEGSGPLRTVRTGPGAPAKTGAGASDSDGAPRSRTEQEMDKLEKRLILYLADNPGSLERFRAWSTGHFTEAQNERLFTRLLERRDRGERLGRESVLADSPLEMAEAILQESEQVGASTSLDEILQRMEKTRASLLRQQLLKQMEQTQDPEAQRRIMEQIRNIHEIQDQAVNGRKEVT